jgi:hypothetical protein
MAAQGAHRSLQVDLDPAERAWECEYLFERSAEAGYQALGEVGVVERAHAGVVLVRSGVFFGVVGVVARVAGDVDVFPRDFVWRVFDRVQRYA